jgi:general secretion pathway protein G
MTHKGFTLVELLIVVLILGTLTAIVVPRIAVSAEGGKISACRTNVQLINRQIEKFKIDTGDWPNVLSELTNNPDYFPDGPPECPFGNPYVINETTHRVIRHKHLLTSKTAWVLEHLQVFN